MVAKITLPINYWKKAAAESHRREENHPGMKKGTITHGKNL